MAIPGNFLSLTTESMDPNVSGWTPRINCTISQGTGGRNGDGTLRLASSAAGEMQARTASSYDVTSGEIYAAFADASGVTVPERIGIRWITASNAEVGITWGLTTSTASSSWHRIGVGGVAPMGATRAQVLVSATAAGAGVVNHFENVYFGWPLRFAGNLLSFNAEQMEISAAGWAVESNCALSTSVPMLQWPVDWYWAGGEMLTLTVTANGNAAALSPERPPVTPGAEYVAYGYLTPPTSGSAAWIELRYYNAAGVQVQANRSVLAAPGTGLYRQITSGVAPATAATASVAIGITGATAGQIVRSDGVVLKARTTVITGSVPETSVVAYADAEFEAGVGQWTVTSGTGTIARSTPWGAQSVSASYSLTLTSATATATTLRSGKYPVQQLLSWRPAVTFHRTAGSWTVSLSVRWYDATDTLISTSTSPADPLPATGWWTFFNDFTAPAGAVTGQVELPVTATSTSSVLQIDWVRLSQRLPASQVTADDATASIQLVVRELDTTRTMTLYRITQGGARTIVRGRTGLLDNVPVSAETLVVEDYEAPLGVPVSYRLEMYDGTTGVYTGSTSTTSVTIDPGDRNYSWLKDPARPQLNVRVMVKQAPDWSQPIDRAVMRIRGRQNALVLSGVRSGREGSLVLWTQTDQGREALRLLLATGSVLLWQSTPEMGEPDIYVSVGDSAAPRVVPYAPEPWREWTLPLTEVDRPITGLAGSGTWTVQDVLVENATVLSLLDRYATVLVLALDQRTT
ncbi:hypothetical protein [Streptomyces sp. B1I3]|uniref:hypothetical protein n=1 Tax=Streptomyces sp. B1I3 TaxID=3042264 RepID=UPI00277FD0F1|nr:hypothetical protein [Streptomyces sp. B1I3]MDQ0791957.1 hypothetical protein [Streptomyces sp. B1I3]